MRVLLAALPFSLLLTSAMALLGAGAASAAPHDYLIRWTPSTSSGIGTYVLAVGTASGQYDVELDLGIQPVAQGEMQTVVQLDDTVDLHLALRARSQAGLFSAYSNEVLLTAGASVPTNPPAPPPDPGGGGLTFGVTAVTGVSPVMVGSVPVVADVASGTGSVVFLVDGVWAKTENRAPYSLAGDSGWNAIRAWDSTTVSDGLHTLTAIGYEGVGGNGAQGRSVSVSFTVDNVPDVALSSLLGLVTGSEASGAPSRIDTLDEYGFTTPLFVDSRAADGDLRPAWCDLDGDGDLDLVLGFGTGGNGRTLTVLLAAGAVESIGEIDLGHLEVTAAPGQVVTYGSFNGETTPACGDLDGDGRNEIAIGIGAGPALRLHVHDDITTGYAEYPHTDGSLLTDIGFGGVLDASRGVWPVIGDFDGDGLGELLVTRTGAGEAGIAVFDDALQGFTAVYSDVGVDGDAVPFSVPPEIAFAHDGSLRPAVGDLDGDGRDEVVLGLGPGGGRRIYILDDALTGFQKIIASTSTSDGSLQVGPHFVDRSDRGSRPGVGDFDGDGLPEIAVAYDTPDLLGQLYLVDDIARGFAPFSSPAGFVGVLWAGTQRPVAPAIGD